MKYLGNIKVTLLKERQEYKELFSPLLESEYADLRESIRNGGIVNDLIVGRDGDGYVLLSGHHRKMVAEELGIDEVPCSLAETPEEIVEALFDNASRRQMTEAERKAKIQEKDGVQDRFFEERLIPEIYALYKEGDRQEIDRRVPQRAPRCPEEHPRLPLRRAGGGPRGVLEKHGREIASIEGRYKEESIASGRSWPKRRPKRRKPRKRSEKNRKNWKR